MKKQLRLAAIVAGTAILAAACASPSASTAPSPAASVAPSADGSAAPAGLTGEVTLWHSYGSGGGETRKHRRHCKSRPDDPQRAAAHTFFRS